MLHVNIMRQRGQRFPPSIQARKAAAITRYLGLGRSLDFHSRASDQFSQYGCKRASWRPGPSTHLEESR